MPGVCPEGQQSCALQCDNGFKTCIYIPEFLLGFIFLAEHIPENFLISIILPQPTLIRNKWILGIFCLINPTVRKFYISVILLSHCIKTAAILTRSPQHILKNYYVSILHWGALWYNEVVYIVFCRYYKGALIIFEFHFNPPSNIKIFQQLHFKFILLNGFNHRINGAP